MAGNSYHSLPTDDPVGAVLADGFARFEQGVDGTVGVEEEYSLLDPETLDLVPKFLAAEVAACDAGLNEAVVGELLASEIEFRTGPHNSWLATANAVAELRAGVVDVLAGIGLTTSLTGTHPWADYRTQDKIDTDYYQSLINRLQWVAHRNNTFGLHVHVGVTGADRAVWVADALRVWQPVLTALSASSPFLDGHDTGMASMRLVTFSRSFPRAGVAPRFGDWQGFVQHMSALRTVGAIESVGQVWWGVRPHPVHGTVELRMFDGQPDVDHTGALAALACGLVLALAHMYDTGQPQPVVPDWAIEENMWRSARHGLNADFLLPSGDGVDQVAAADGTPGVRTVSANDAVLELLALARSADDRCSLGFADGLDEIEQMVAAGGSSGWQRLRLEQNGRDLHATFGDVVALSTAGSRRLAHTSGTTAAAGVRQDR